MANKRIHCKFCDAYFMTIEDYAAHLEKSHSDLLPKDMTPKQYAYFLITGRDRGVCMVCKGKTPWDEKTTKYKRLCTQKYCHDKYVEMFRERMTNKYGKTTLLNDPEQQKKMLANRKISGVYTWSRDPRFKIPYTGQYEKAFLSFLDYIMEMDADNIMSPSPHVYYYEYEGKKHFYIPDVFIPSLNLEIEVKDGGDNPNTHPKIQAVDKVNEKLKDEVLCSKSIPFDYIKIVNKDHKRFFEYLEKSNKRELDGTKNKIIII